MTCTNFRELVNYNSHIILDAYEYLDNINDGLRDDITPNHPKIKRLKKALGDAILLKKDLTSMILYNKFLYVFEPLALCSF